MPHERARQREVGLSWRAKMSETKESFVGHTKCETMIFSRFESRE